MTIKDILNYDSVELLMLVKTVNAVDEDEATVDESYYLETSKESYRLNIYNDYEHSMLDIEGNASVDCDYHELLFNNMVEVGTYKVVKHHEHDEYTDIESLFLIGEASVVRIVVDLSDDYYPWSRIDVYKFDGDYVEFEACGETKYRVYRNGRVEVR